MKFRKWIKIKSMQNMFVVKILAPFIILNSRFN